MVSSSKYLGSSPEGAAVWYEPSSEVVIPPNWANSSELKRGHPILVLDTETGLNSEFGIMII